MHKGLLALQTALYVRVYAIHTTKTPSFTGRRPLGSRFCPRSFLHLTSATLHQASPPFSKRREQSLSSGLSSDPSCHPGKKGRPSPWIRAGSTLYTVDPRGLFQWSDRVSSGLSSDPKSRRGSGTGVAAVQINRRTVMSSATLRQTSTRSRRRGQSLSSDLSSDPSGHPGEVAQLWQRCISTIGRWYHDTVATKNRLYGGTRKTPRVPRGYVSGERSTAAPPPFHAARSPHARGDVGS